MASLHNVERPSTPMQATREDSVTPPEYKPHASPSKMFSIQSLLNPSGPGNTQGQTREKQGRSPPPTSPSPALTVSTTLRSGTPGTPSSIRGKRGARDNVAFNRGPPTGGANYPPFEVSDPAIALSSDDQQELAQQHMLFHIKPSEKDGDGQIRNFTRYIPYSSDKKNFFLKTGKEGFHVFQYTFRVPDDPSRTEYTVMWDYGNGLTRITPFFKACNHIKTVPAKALQSNPGLKDLAHSITGGALAAQGYWIPYACARAICLTFCYHIRWALTPIFGPSFIRECLPPSDHGYQRFKMDSETIRNATLEAEGWKQASAHASSSAEIPRSVPQTSSAAAGAKELRPRDNRSMFKDGSPFQSDDVAGYESDYERARHSALRSPRISPKTPAHETFETPTWTSINGHHRHGLSSTNHASPLNQSLLNQPHQFASWRDADTTTTTTNTTDRKASLRSHQKQATLKRRRSVSPEAVTGDANYNDEASSTTSSMSESDDEDIVMSPPKKRVRRIAPKHMSNDSPASQSSTSTPHQGKSVLFTAEDYRVADLLLKLNKQDHQLAFNPSGQADGQR